MRAESWCSLGWLLLLRVRVERNDCMGICAGNFCFRDSFSLGREIAIFPVLTRVPVISRDKR